MYVLVVCVCVCVFYDVQQNGITPLRCLNCAVELKNETHVDVQKVLA